jgi:hypothetical protein
MDYKIGEPHCHSTCKYFKVLTIHKAQHEYDNTIEYYECTCRASPEFGKEVFPSMTVCTNLQERANLAPTKPRRSYKPVEHAPLLNPRVTPQPPVEQEYKRWQFYVGIENSKGNKLTDSMLRKWLKDPNRRLECVFDGETWPADNVYCPRCREYKGLQPYIPEWSDWG